MIHNLRHMIGSPEVGESHPTRGYVRAVPCPFYGGLLDRLRDAAAVVKGSAFAVRWPKGGELEHALGDKWVPPAVERELDRLRSMAQSRYELLRECQAEFKAMGAGKGGVYEAIERKLSRDPSKLEGRS